MEKSVTFLFTVGLSVACYYLGKGAYERTRIAWLIGRDRDGWPWEVLYPILKWGAATAAFYLACAFFAITAINGAIT